MIPILPTQGPRIGERWNLGTAYKNIEFILSARDICGNKHYIFKNTDTGGSFIIIDRDHFFSYPRELISLGVDKTIYEPFGGQMRQKLICILGITCTGKDTLVERMVEKYPDVGAVQVGKEFRKRYPPERFKGLGAMPDTEKESWEIFDEQLALCKDKSIVLITAQPRMESQVNEIMNRCVIKPEFYALTCSKEELQRRIIKRFDNQEEGWLTLAQQRVNNDKIQLYEVLLTLAKWDVSLAGVLDTTDALDEVAKYIYTRH